MRFSQTTGVDEFAAILLRIVYEDYDYPIHKVLAVNWYRVGLLMTMA